MPPHLKLPKNKRPSANPNKACVTCKHWLQKHEMCAREPYVHLDTEKAKLTVCDSWQSQNTTRSRQPKSKIIHHYRPTVVCLCGSTRFSKAFQRANLDETLKGRIVLTIGCDMRSDADVFADKSPDELSEIKARLDELHLRKIDMADEVLILNVDGYIGESTRRELMYATQRGKRVRFLEQRES